MKKLSKPASLLVTQFTACLILMAASLKAGAPNLPPTNVPEPGPMGLLALGFVALLIARRMNRNK